MTKQEELINRIANLTDEQVDELCEYFCNEKFNDLLDALRSLAPDQLERFFNHRFTIGLLKLDGYDYAVVTAFVGRILEVRGVAV